MLLRPGTSRSNESAMSRLIQANKPQQQSKFASNVVSTTKYNAFTFLPLFFFESFRRYSNAFFLFIACLQQIPDVSPTGRWTTLVPLSFILFVSACKEIFEDIKRRIADGTVNNRKVLVYKNGYFTEVRWRDIRVGDIVKVLNREEIPADLILLTSSEPQVSFLSHDNSELYHEMKIPSFFVSFFKFTPQKTLRKFIMITRQLVSYGFTKVAHNVLNLVVLSARVDKRNHDNGLFSFELSC